MKEYLAAAVHRAAKFEAGMSAADAEAMCFEFNAGRDPSKGGSLVYNGAAIFITGSTPAKMLTVEAGNWIVSHPDGSIDVRADADFQTSFVPAAS